jgi:hypothetical protein
MAEPITPPTELINQWKDKWFDAKVKHIDLNSYLINEAARWGSDQELEACCEWTEANNPGYWDAHKALRAARRPKPLSLKEQALEAFDFIGKCHPITGPDWATIRRALEQLPDPL